MVFNRIKKFFQPFEFTTVKKVELGKILQSNDLVEILIKAAKDMKLEAKASDEFNEHYVLGSLKKEQTYMESEVKLEGNGFSGRCSFNRYLDPGRFYIHFKPSQKTMAEEYLNVVSKYI